MKGLFIGVVATRIGIRRVAMTGAVINGSATVLGSLTTGILQLYICNAMSGKSNLPCRAVKFAGSEGGEGLFCWVGLGRVGLGCVGLWLFCGCFVVGLGLGLGLGL